MGILIRGAWVYTGHTLLADAEVLVEGDRIRHVGPVGEVGEEGHTVLTGPGWVVLPGLINTHTHAAMTLLRGYADDQPLRTWLEEYIWPAEEQFTAQDVALGTRLACLEMMATGTTTFADMYFHMEAVAEVVLQAGMRALLARGLIGVGPRGQEALAEAEGLYREYHGAQGRVRVFLGPHAPYTCPPEYLRRVAEAAGRLGTGIHMHLAETVGEVEECLQRYGRTPFGLAEDTGLLEHPLLAAHAVHPRPEDVVLAPRLQGLAHCPASNLKLASGVMPLRRWQEAGGRVGLGTDGAASTNTLDMFREMRLAALLAKERTGDPAAVTARQVLHLATLGAATALGWQEEIGSLEPGKQADVIAVSLDRPGLQPVHDPLATLAYSATGQDVQLTMVAGRVLYRQGEFFTLEPGEVVRQAQERARAVVRPDR